MKKKCISLTISLLFLLLICFTTHNIAMAQEINEEKVYCEIDESKEFADDTIMVVLTNNVSLSTKQYTVEDFPEISCVEVNDLTEELWQWIINHQHSIDCNPELETKAETFNRILKLTISNSDKTNVIDGIMKLEKRNDVKSAEPDYVISCNTTLNDIYYASYQWGVDQIDLPNAWTIETGKGSVLVGVVDSGIDITHPYLANRVNTSLSKDFANDLDTYEINPFEDNTGHGTHVAGIIGAEWNNDKSMVGACRNVSLVSLKVSNTSNGYHSSSVTEAIQYAESNHIRILNMSFTFSSFPSNINDAVENYTGLIVCAAGNTSTGGINIDEGGYNRFPACFTNDNVLTVGASNSLDERATFSNYGLKNVDIFAPGVSIYSTVPSNYGDQTGYAYMSGTSMATPFVAGVAALLLSHDSTLTARAIKETILNNCDEVGVFKDECVTGGRLNAYKSLANIHNHTFTYSYVNSSLHTKYCKCGYSATENHSYTAHRCIYCGSETSHAYTDKFTWLNYQKHTSFCTCGETKVEGHVISSSPTILNKKYDKCLRCGGDAEIGFAVIGSMSEIQIVTENGSYILPNGVTVLVEEDIAAFLNGTLVFISSNSK